MKKKGLAIIGLAAVLGIGGTVGVCAATKKIIKMEDGKRVEINVEQNQETKTELLDLPYSGGDETIAIGTEDETGEVINSHLEPTRLWGNVLEKMDGSFSIDSQAQEGYRGEIIIHFDPDNTLVLDSVTGFPAEKETIAEGQMLYVYVSPMMTMSLPPQTTAALVLVNVPQDIGAPLYVTAQAPLEKDTTGNFLLKTKSGEEIKIPADCPITPYLTRQMVRLEDIDEGRKCLIWMDADNWAEKIVLFNE